MALQAELCGSFHQDQRTFYFDLQRRLSSWLTDINMEHTVSGSVQVKKRHSVVLV